MVTIKFDSKESFVREKPKQSVVESYIDLKPAWATKLRYMSELRSRATSSSHGEPRIRGWNYTHYLSKRGRIIGSCWRSFISFSSWLVVAWARSSFKVFGAADCQLKQLKKNGGINMTINSSKSPEIIFK